MDDSHCSIAVYNIGARTRQWSIASADFPALAQRGIATLGCSAPGRGYHVVRPRPDFAHIHLCFGAGAQIIVNNRWIAPRRGASFLHPAGVAHGARWQRRGWRFGWISFLPGQGPTEFREAMLEEIDTIEAVLRVIERANAARLDLALPLLLELLQPLLAPARQGDARLARLAREISRDVAHEWTARAMAQRVSMSAMHLHRLWLRDFGQSPAHWVRAVRLREASRLLRTGTDKLEVVAVRVGYHDVFAFSRAFRRFTGLSPTAYRKASQSPY